MMIPPRRKRNRTPSPARARRRGSSHPSAAPPAAVSTPLERATSEIGSSNLSLHELFEQQAADLLERADLDEEQRQSILLAMSCPCCGAGGMSYTFKLKWQT
jgi:hypothetical protein